MFLLILWLLSKSTHAHQNYITISPLNYSGLYYSYQNELGFVVNTWNYIINIDYIAVKERLFELQNVSNTLQTSMDKGNKLSACDWEQENGYGFRRELNYSISNKIVNLLEIFDNIDYMLMHKRLTKHRRIKRGLFGGAFDFVGRAYKYLFGVMDDEDAAVLYEIAGRANDTDYRVKTLTNDTLRIAENLQNIKQDYEYKIECKIVQQQLNYLKDNLQEIENIINKLITAIEMSLNNRLSPLLVHPHTLLNEMESVDSKHYDRESTWVYPPTHEYMHSILRIIKCNVFINPVDQLMFVVQIPRIDKSKFELYKPIALPECDQNRICKFVSPQSQYVGFQKNDYNHYVRLDDTSMCTVLDTMTLCYGSITNQKTDYSPDCDVRMFKKLKNDKCQVHATKFHNEIFYNLNNVNKWLYMVFQPIQAKLNCGSGNYDKTVTLHKIGILTIHKYCKLKTLKTILVSKHLPNYEDTKHVVIDFNFTRFVIPKDYYLGNKIAKNLDYESLDDITKSLKSLITQEEADNPLTELQKDDTTNANWYLNIFGNWWWELKFIFYTICIIFVILFAMKIKQTFCGDVSCFDQRKLITLSSLSPK
nr:efp [Darna trima granulovirus]